MERRLLSHFMTGAVGRYSASPASPQQSIIPLAADKRTPLILLLPPTLSETFKAFSLAHTHTRTVMCALILRVSPQFVSRKPRETCVSHGRKRVSTCACCNSDSLSASDYKPVAVWKQCSSFVEMLSVCGKLSRDEDSANDCFCTLHQIAHPQYCLISIPSTIGA